MSEENVLTHKGCGGRLVLNAASIFRFLTPNISFSTDGIIIGPLELQEKDTKSPASLCCANCSKEINLPDDEDEIEVRCAICREKKPVKEIYTCRHISAVCSSCKEYMSKESKTPVPENIQRVIRYFDFSASEIKFTMLTTVFKKPVRI